MPIYAQVGIEGLIQLGALVWMVATIRSDVRNLTGWVQKIDQRSEETALKVEHIRGRIED